MRYINYPETKRVDVTEEHFGHTITDPYRWLENDVRSDEDVARWVNAQNVLTQRYLATLSGRDVFRERLATLLNYEQFTPPIKRGGRYFFTKNPGRDNQHTLRMRDDVDGEDRVVIDPNDWSEDSADALAEWAASDDGRLLAYGVQTGGTDWRTIRVLDVDTGKVFDDKVNWARFTASSGRRMVPASSIRAIRNPKRDRPPRRMSPTTPFISTRWERRRRTTGSSIPIPTGLPSCIWSIAPMTGATS